MFFNPLKLAWNMVCLSVMTTALGFTHYQAFRFGANVQQNAIARNTAEMMGVLPKPQATPAKPEDKQEDIPLLSDAWEWVESLIAPPVPPKR